MTLFPVKKWKREIIEEFFTHTTTVIPMINMSYDQELFLSDFTFGEYNINLFYFSFYWREKTFGCGILTLSIFWHSLNNLKFSLQCKT